MFKIMKLTREYTEQLDEFVDSTIIPFIEEDVSIPDMRDVNEDDDDYDNIWEERKKLLLDKVYEYLKNKLP